MSWNGPSLDEEQEAVFDMLNDLGDSLAGEQNVVKARESVVETGIWALSAAEDFGGAGAEMPTALLALERLGRFYPALGWASAQAQTAVTVLAESSQQEMAGDVAEGRSAAAIVEIGSPNVSLTESDGTWTGHIDRIDMTAQSGNVIVLNGAHTALIFNTEMVTFQPQHVSGINGAETQSVALDAVTPETVELDLTAVRGFLYLGAAAVAAGIAGAAADAAREYAINRNQFGASLIHIPVVRQALAEQQLAVTQSINVVMGADVSDCRQVVGALQLATENAIKVTGMALQSHGGYGYLDEYPAGQYVRDALSIRASVDTFSVSRHAALSNVDLPTIKL